MRERDRNARQVPARSSPTLSSCVRVNDGPKEAYGHRFNLKLLQLAGDFDDCLFADWLMYLARGQDAARDSRKSGRVG